MIIVCSNCKKVIGEQKPYNDSSEIKATCTDCIKKAKEKATQFVPHSKPNDGKEIVLENGMKGILSIAKKGSSELSLHEIAVSGERFYCSKETREEFQKYMNGIPGNEVDVTFLYSAVLDLSSHKGGRRKKNAIKEPIEEKPKSTEYNCTIKAPKEYALRMFDGMAERTEKFTDFLANSAYEAYMKDMKEKANKGVTPSSETVPLPDNLHIQNPKN